MRSPAYHSYEIIQTICDSVYTYIVSRSAIFRFNLRRFWDPLRPELVEAGEQLPNVGDRCRKLSNIFRNE
jgi:hypothetical protein